MSAQISMVPSEKEENRIVAGIDVGLGGAVFFLDLDRQPAFGDAIDIPVHSLERGGKTKREPDIQGLAILLSRPLLHAFVEAVSAMPRQGVTSMFSFGKVYGVILGVLSALEIPTTLIAPAKWKRALQVPKGKHGARARASQLLPACAPLWRFAEQHGRAEAALIALYGARLLLMTSSDVQLSGKRPEIAAPAGHELLSNR